VPPPEDEITRKLGRVVAAALVVAVGVIVLLVVYRT